MPREDQLTVRFAPRPGEPRRVVVEGHVWVGLWGCHRPARAVYLERDGEWECEEYPEDRLDNLACDRAFDRFIAAQEAA